MPMWRNWQTHTTQNRTGNHVGSSPTIGTSMKNYFFPSKEGVFLYTKTYLKLLMERKKQIDGVMMEE